MKKKELTDMPTNIPIPIEAYNAIYEDRSKLIERGDPELYLKIMKLLLKTDVSTWRTVATLKSCLLKSIYFAVQLDAREDNKKESEDLK